MIAAGMCLAKKCGAPLALCRITTISTFIERMLFTVSRRVSPLETDEDEAVKLIVSADSDVPQGIVVQAMLRARTAGAQHFLIAVKHE